MDDAELRKAYTRTLVSAHVPDVVDGMQIVVGCDGSWESRRSLTE